MEGFFSQWRLIVKGVINDSDLCKLPQRYQKKSYTHTLSYSGRKQVQHHGCWQKFLLFYEIALASSAEKKKVDSLININLHTAG